MGFLLSVATSTIAPFNATRPHIRHAVSHVIKIGAIAAKKKPKHLGPPRIVCKTSKRRNRAKNKLPTFIQKTFNMYKHIGKGGQLFSVFQ